MIEYRLEPVKKRLNIANNTDIDNAEPDFVCYIGKGENGLTLPLEFSKIADFTVKGECAFFRFKDEFLRECLEGFANGKIDINKAAENTVKSEDFFIAYAKIRLAAIPQTDEFPDCLKKSAIARTIALNSVPRKIDGNNEKLLLVPAMDPKNVAKLFYLYDRYRQNDSELDGSLLNFVGRYIESGT